MLINGCKYNARLLWIVFVCIVLFDVLQLFSSHRNDYANNQVCSPLILSEAISDHSGTLLEPNILSFNGPIIYKIKIPKWQPLSIEYLSIWLLPQALPHLGHKQAALRSKKCSFLLFPKHYFW